ncbi:MAG: YbgC/FadM family acyl-CoA thioesterase [Rhodoferax sp.]|nr:YbgC/FadM family acyl-CoA thioesterase [Rhodoferax sp.]
MTRPEPDFRLIHPLRVRWAEIDLQKIVFNPHYLMYIDTAFTDYWRALAVPYEAIPPLLGGDLFVKKSTVEYHDSARLDDRLDVGVRCVRIGNSSMLFEAGIFRGNELLVSAELVYVFADPATQTSKPVPDALRTLLTGFEAGETMTQTSVGSWAQLGAQAAPLRQTVFTDELGIPASIEQDDADATALHAVICNRLGQPVGTGRLLRDGDAHARDHARIGRVAVTRALRGSGLGRDVIKALMDAAASRGDRQVSLHAQRNAEGFYTRLGFVVSGEPFEEAGIAHIEMSCALVGSR